MPHHHTPIKSLTLLCVCLFIGCINTLKDSASADDASIPADSAVEDSGIEVDTDEENPYTYVLPSTSICDDTFEYNGGFLCAIQPSRLDSEARDQYSNASVADRRLGFGYHAVGFPSESTDILGIYVHFTGSMGRPYNQRTNAFDSSVLLKEAIEAGYIVLQVAYHNRYAVNSEAECYGALDVDNCAGLVRQEKIMGEDVSTVVDVPISDSITHRLIVLVNYLQTNGVAFPDAVVDGEDILWPNLRLGGHSQGSGHALYIHKYWASLHTCLLGGPFDVADAVPNIPDPVIADWYLDSVLVDIGNLRALVSEEDNNYDQFVRAYNVLGLIEGLHWSSFTSESYFNELGESITGHGAVVHDPAYRSLRHTTCFGEVSSRE